MYQALRAVLGVLLIVLNNTASPPRLLFVNAANDATRVQSRDSRESHINWNNQEKQQQLLAKQSGKHDEEEEKVPRALIVGGRDVSSADVYPYFVFSRFGRRGGCGGTLIHPDIVLTAAHCQSVYEGRGLVVGQYQLEDDTAGEFFEDDALLVHPEYDSSVEFNDIMLVKLQGISDAPLVQLNTDPNLPADGATVRVVGLGRTSDGGDLPDTLQEVDVLKVDFQTCFDFWDGSVPIGDERQVCAGVPEGGRDACQTDSGGPLFDVATGFQIGIVSLGDGCAQPNSPSVYTRVSGYTQFIQDGICPLSEVPPEACISEPPSEPPTLAPTYSPTLAPTLSPTGRPITNPPTVAPTTQTPSVSASPSSRRIPTRSPFFIRPRPPSHMNMLSKKSGSSTMKMKMMTMKKMERKSKKLIDPPHGYEKGGSHTNASQKGKPNYAKGNAKGYAKGYAKRFMKKHMYKMKNN